MSASNYHCAIICPNDNSGKTCGELYRSLPACNDCVWNSSYSYNTNIASSTWQLCPKCNGYGIISNSYSSIGNWTFITCDVCGGKKIISMFTGKPPVD